MKATSMEKQDPKRADLILRPLGATERYVYTFTHLKFYNNVCIAVAISKPGTFTGDLRVLVYKALSAAVKKHTALASAIPERETREPCFVRLETLDLSEVVSFHKIVSDDQDRNSRIDEILSEQSNIGFDAVDKPLWRAVIVEPETPEEDFCFDFFFMWHHAIGDGKSGFAVLSTFLDALNSLNVDAKDKSCDASNLNNGTSGAGSIVSSSTQPLSLPVEDILELRTTRKSMGQKLLEKYKSRFVRIKAVPGAWSSGPVSATPPIQTVTRHISIHEASLTRILKRCRTESTTLTPLLIAVIGKAILDTFEAQSVKCSIAMSVRRLFPQELSVDDSVMGLWASGFKVDCTRAALYNSVGRAAVWDVARAYSQRMAQEITKGDMDLFIAALKNMKDMKPALLGKIGKPRDAGFTISNLGAYPFHTGERDIPAQSPWQVKDIVFSQSSNVSTSAMIVSVVGLKHGGLSIAASWQVGIVADEDASCILSHVNSHLLEYSKEES